MTTKDDAILKAYREATLPIPETMLAWPLYGAGMENLGENDAPVRWKTPANGPDELLARVDACGLCFSDVKILRQGPNHPRLQGRDMKKDPVVMGHEVCLTIVRVGENLRDRYRPGQRFIVQADIWYEGRNLAYGYKIQGGLAQYGVIGKEILAGDDGCYLIPIREETGYAQAALVEPWACVIAAYELNYRRAPKKGGKALIVGAPGDPAIRLSVGFDPSSHPDRVFLVGYDGCADGEACGAETVVRDRPADDAWAEACREWTGGEGFDDIIVSRSLSGTAISSLGLALANGGILCLVGEGSPEGSVQMDVGRVHYDGILWIGTDGWDIGPAYAHGVRRDLQPGGTAWFVGAGGPMGRMHVQRAIEKNEGPSVIVATDVSDLRLRDLEESYRHRAEEAGRRLICINPTARDAAETDRLLREASGGRGFDDIVLLAPIPALVTDSMRFLGEGGVLNIFAGVGRGTMADVDPAVLTDRRMGRIIGSTASSIDDMRLMLKQTESGELSTNRSVAAVGGIRQAKEGLQALMDNVYPGKVVIYPQIEDFPLTALPDLKDVLPEVYARLERGRVWTNEAEEAFLAALLAGDRGK